MKTATWWAGLGVLALAGLAGGSEPKGGTAAPPAIEVVGPWGKAGGADVLRVLESAAGQLLPHAGERKLAKILVAHQEGRPITWYRKGPHGEIQIRLSARDTFWCQYTYQFAHELGHVLCNHDQRKEGRNFWFEEGLADTASLFVLRRMGDAWTKRPPYPNWKDFAPAFGHYANALLVQPHRRLPPDRTMAQWLRENLPALARERVLTPRSELAAAYLLPLFEEDPKSWEALRWINRGERDAEADLETYLRGWQGRVPERHRAFVGKIRKLFGYGPR